MGEIINYTGAYIFVIALIVYAFRDWYVSACGLVLFMAVYRYEAMPESLLGITGLNLWNIAFVGVCLGYLISAKQEKRSWDAPRWITFLLIYYMFVVLSSVVRMNWDDSALLYELGNFPLRTMSDYWKDLWFLGLKFSIPGILLFMGCNSRKRFLLAVFALAGMHLLLSLLTIKHVPLSWLKSGDISRYAGKMITEELGLYRTNLSVMQAGGIWILVALAYYFKRPTWTLGFYFATVINLFGLLLTGSRGGYLAFTVIGLFKLLTRYRRYLILAPIGVVIILLWLPSVKDRITGESIKHAVSDSNTSLSEEEKELDQLSAGRTLFWPKVLDKIVERPWTGYGYEGIIASEASTEHFEEYSFAFIHPHNAYLQFVIDNGLIGAVPVFVFYMLMGLYAWRLYFHRHDDLCRLAGAVGIAVLGTFLFGCLTGQSFYPAERMFGTWCVIGLLLRVYVEQRKLLFAGSPEEKKKDWRSPAAESERLPALIWSGVATSK